MIDARPARESSFLGSVSRAVMKQVSALSMEPFRKRTNPRLMIFFTLSGFLITNFLLHRASVTDFLIRRFSRIIPLAWLFCLVTLLLIRASYDQWMAHLFFYANWPPMQLTEVTGHLWSLCVEMQFYIGVAFLYLILRDRGLLLLPIICIGVTLFRIANGVHVAINTYYRVDEILAGCILALAFNQRLGEGIQNTIKNFNPYILLIAFVVSCHPASGFMNYFRPYLASLLIGWTLFNHNTLLTKLLAHRYLVYLASISFALYVIHPLLSYTWLGQGETWIKYAKRPVLFVILFILAHMSTFYYEHPCIELGKRLSNRLRAS